MLPRVQLVLAAIVFLACSSAMPADAIAAFPDSASRDAVVGQVVAPQVGDVTPHVLTTATTATSEAAAAAAKPNLRSAADATASSGSTPSAVLPGENGFGHVSYSKTAPAARSASDSSAQGSGSAVESQAAYRARIRKKEKENELKYPYLKMQNRIAI